MNHGLLSEERLEERINWYLLKAKHLHIPEPEAYEKMHRHLLGRARTLLEAYRSIYPELYREYRGRL